MGAIPITCDIAVVERKCPHTRTKQKRLNSTKLCTINIWPRRMQRTATHSQTPGARWQIAENRVALRCAERSHVTCNLREQSVRVWCAHVERRQRNACDMLIYEYAAFMIAQSVLHPWSHFYRCHKSSVLHCIAAAPKVMGVIYSWINCSLLCDWCSSDGQRVQSYDTVQFIQYVFVSTWY